MKMPSKPLFFFFFSKILLRKLVTLLFSSSSSSESNKIITNNNSSINNSLQNHSFLLKKPQNELLEKTLVFDMEGALLKSQSLFPYFMLVAFEAGGLIRALILLLLYPFVCLLGEDDLGLKLMVFVSFFGIRKDGFRAGTAVLPKFFLEDVGLEGLDGVMKFEKKIGVSGNLPRIMIEGFLKEYLGVESVLGRELVVFNGYFVGLMEGKDSLKMMINDIDHHKKIGIGCSSNTSLLRQLHHHCKEVYLVNKWEKRNWQILNKEKYPKPLIFHDSRLVFRPTPFATVAMFMWLPFGLILSVMRMAIGILLPFEISCLIHALTGAEIIISKPKQSTMNNEKQTGVLYVTNHRTLLDPIYISLALMKPVNAVTYSMSRFNEVISPIKTVRLTRQRETDRQRMNKMLSQADVVVCPEGTTCREPYLLRFSPLFAEITDEIVPVAMNVDISMFYGSTASGFKCFDPIFHFLNPKPACSVKILDKLSVSQTHTLGGASKYDVANDVQTKIAKTLGFQCTNLTRKDKYIILAGNNGIV